VADDEPVFHIGDGRSRPSREFGFVALEPGAKDAASNHFVAGLDRDAIGIDLSLVPERLLYFHQDLCRFRARLDRDHVRHAFHTVDPTHGVVGAFLTCCRSTRRLRVTQSGQLPGSANPSRRTNFGPT
jgi:hypothetical protein